MVGDPIVLTVNATGGGLAYQWQKGGSDISGANASTYVVAHAALGDAGDYNVVVSNLAGSVTSDPAHVAVDALPEAGTDAGMTDAGGDASPLSDAGPDGLAPGDSGPTSDSGNPVSDSGNPVGDSGNPDAASANPDSGTYGDAGGDAGPGASKTSASGGGCSCSVAGGEEGRTAPLLGGGLFLLGLALATRRRRRR